jgi:ribosomal protein S18 acetylase RimI-like enzyme
MVGEKPIQCADKMGDRFELTVFSAEDRQALIEMYDQFSPKAITQGLPPADDRARHNWIGSLIEQGENFLAWQGGVVVGHSSLLPAEKGQDGEYLIFVNSPYRNRGLGTALTRVAVERAVELGLESVWLTVEALNFRAIKLYKKIGFTFCDAGERERTMVLKSR